MPAAQCLGLPGQRCERIVLRPQRRCPTHEKAWQQRRGTTTQRGYGTKHQRLRGKMLTRITRCHYCGTLPSVDNPMTADHRVPVVKGGKTEPSNYVPACRRCNSGKGAKLPDTPA